MDGGNHRRASATTALGVAGVNWSVKIRPIRVLGITGDGSNFDIAQGILYAAGLPATGAGGAAGSGAVACADHQHEPRRFRREQHDGERRRRRVDAGSLIVASAGNDGVAISRAIRRRIPNVMGVAAVGQDGALATYSNAGTFISVAAPGGDFRLDDNGGGGVLGPGWNFATGKADLPVRLRHVGVGTVRVRHRGAAPRADADRSPRRRSASRIEQFATRPAGTTRSDTLWMGHRRTRTTRSRSRMVRRTRRSFVSSTRRLAAVVKTATVNAAGAFSFTRVATGTYYVQAGDDESGDGAIGVPGRRFTWAGGFGAPTVFNVNGNAQAVAIALGMPAEVEPNDDVAHANMLTPDSYVVGSITTPDVRDMYVGQHRRRRASTRSKRRGSSDRAAMGIELDTFLSVVVAGGNGRRIERQLLVGDESLLLTSAAHAWPPGSTTSPSRARAHPGCRTTDAIGCRSDPVRRSESLRKAGI